MTARAQDVEAGRPIAVGIAPSRFPPGVDTESDLDAVRAAYETAS